jgi:hypothetical protein
LEKLFNRSWAVVPVKAEGGDVGAARPEDTMEDVLGLMKLLFIMLDGNTGVVGKADTAPGGEVGALEIISDTCK